MTTVLCAGIAVIDFVMSMDEMPRLAEKYRARNAAVVGGGCAANASVGVARLGGHALLAAQLGDDPIGGMILADLEKDGVDCSLVRRYAGHRSSFSCILIDAKGDRQIVNFRDQAMESHADWLASEGVPAFDAALADTRWPQGAKAAMSLARARGKPAIMDVEAPSRIAEDALKIATHLAFSEQGLRDYAETDDLETGLRRANTDTSAFVCVTRGDSGVLWLEGGEIRSMPGFVVSVADTLGAGDIWHGAFALALGEGRAEKDAMYFASAVAAIKCTRFGGRSGAPTRTEVEDFVRERS